MLESDECRLYIRQNKFKKKIGNTWDSIFTIESKQPKLLESIFMKSGRNNSTFTKHIEGKQPVSYLTSLSQLTVGQKQSKDKVV